MSWVTVIWSMVASACLTLAVIYWLVWCRNRTAWAHLLFSVTAASTTAFAFCELSADAGADARQNSSRRCGGRSWRCSSGSCRSSGSCGSTWVPGGLARVDHLRPARVLPAAHVPAGAGIVNYREITSLRRIPFLGESVTVLRRHPESLDAASATFAMLLILVFVADASVTAWRRGDRRKALMVGGSVVFFLLAGLLARRRWCSGQTSRRRLSSARCYLGAGRGDGVRVEP